LLRGCLVVGRLVSRALCLLLERDRFPVAVLDEVVRLVAVFCRIPCAGCVTMHGSAPMFCRRAEMPEFLCDFAILVSSLQLGTNCLSFQAIRACFAAFTCSLP
jgi:hypothetical protein